jgi:exopolysaccharide biosynthesis predicted pyruvyltransferase EpsI
MSVESPGLSRRPAAVVHEELRREILADIKLTNMLREFHAAGASYYPSVGNLGDGLIQRGAAAFFRELDLQFPIATGLRRESLDGISLLVVSGGGGWLGGVYNFWEWLLEPLLGRGGKVLILPSTVSGYREFFARYARQITIFARDPTTFAHLTSIEGLDVHLGHDLAFATAPEQFAMYRERRGERNLNIYRKDGERTGDDIPFESIDLALVVNGIQWADADTCDRYLDAAAHLISAFERVTTNRLHMAILAAFLDRKVQMLPNSYFKNEGVYVRSLSRFGNVSFMNAIDPEPASS